MVRFVGRDEPAEAEAFLSEWAPRLASWLDEGRTPYFFTHAPNDLVAPELARRLHEALRSLRPSIPPLPDAPTPRARQQELFGGILPNA